MGKIVLVLAVVAVLGAGLYVLTQDAPDVVVYCALDGFFSEPLLTEFQEESGLKVQWVFDAESVKTVGLTSKLIEEKSNPKCDVFWNNELVNTIRLKNADVLQPYVSSSAADISAAWKDPEGYWTGIAARGRVLILNEEELRKLEPDESKWPSRTEDFLDPKWKGHMVIAKPEAGTTLSHMAVLEAMKGPDFVHRLWEGLRANEIHVATGNAHVMKLVRAGDFAFGWTDTDDCQVAIDEKFPVRRVFPDQEPGGEVTGCLLIPNSIALVKNCPHPENGRKLIDFILSKKVEEALANGPSAQIPVRKSVPRPDYVRSAEDLVTMDVDWATAAASLRPFDAWYKETATK